MSTHAESSDAYDPSGALGAGIWRNLLPSLVGNAVLPFATYLVLTANGMATVPALAISALWCVLEIVFEYVRHRQIDPLGVLVIGFLVAGITSSLIANNVRFSLVKDSVATGLFGTVMLGSLLAPRPLTFYFGKRFATDGSTKGLAWWDGLWQYREFRHSQRFLTALWGLVYVGEAAVRIGLTYVLSTTAMVAVNNFLPLAVLVALVAYTIGYGRRELLDSGSPATKPRTT